MANKNKVHIGNCGEYFVAAELERRDFSVAVPMSNTPVFDLLAIDNTDLSKQICIQVKTTTSENPRWKLNKKCELINKKNIFYVFVMLNGLELPIYYIVPSELVANYTTKNHRNWLDTPGKKGQKHNDSNIRIFDLPSDSEYKNNWELLRKE